MASLVVLRAAVPEQAGLTWKLAARPLVGGREPACEIQILDPKASRRHFMILPLPAGLAAGRAAPRPRHAIRELKSRNGVRVNGQRIRGDQELVDGDLVRIGTTQLVFVAADDDASGPDALRRYRKLETDLRERSTELDED